MDLLLTEKDEISEFQRIGGGKATNMARLSQMGFDVPPWFCITTEAFDAFIAEHHLQNKLRQFHHPAEFSKEIGQLFKALPLPKSIQKAVLAKMEEMGLNDSFVAVRSSGWDEDSSVFSFAGQYSSFLYQKGPDAVFQAIKECCASGFSEKGLSYRLKHGLPLDAIKVGVIVQKMINPEASGVVFSRHPLRPTEGKQLSISSLWGLGEGVVGGQLSADQFNVNRYTFDYTTQIVKKEEKFTQALGGGVVKRQVPEGLQMISSLTPQQVKAVARMAVELEQKLGFPQDCEWAFENEKLYCLQTRPITHCPPTGYYSSTVNGNTATLWDNATIVESYAGVTSPLTFSFVSQAYRSVYEQLCRIVGIPDNVIQSYDNAFRNMLGVIRGRIYCNFINWYKLALLIPGVGGSPRFVETMMEVKQALQPEVAALVDLSSEAPKRTLLNKLKLAAMTFYRFVRAEKVIDRFQKNFDILYSEAKGINFNKLSLREQAKYYQMMEKKILKQWQAPLINDCLFIILYGFLTKLTHAWLITGSEATSLQNDLLFGQGESSEPTKMLMQIASQIAQGEPEFKVWFMSNSAEDVWEGLCRYDRSEEILKLIKQFLDIYGFRSINELKLEEPDLFDNPRFIIEAITSYLRTKNYTIKDLVGKEKAIRSKAEAKVNARLFGWRRYIYYWVLKQTQQALGCRKKMRLNRTKVFGIVRRLFKGMGKNLAQLGILEKSNDVYYLTVDELLDYIEGRTVSYDLGFIATTRKKEYDQYRFTPPPPDRFLTYGAAGFTVAYPHLLEDLNLEKQHQINEKGLFIGKPCCPGVVEGILRVIKSVEDMQNINGEIILLSRTDPGWIPLYPACTGLLIERGDLLSHSAQVARELGLPTIIGIEGKPMFHLRSGQKVEMDATRGIVRLK